MVVKEVFVGAYDGVITNRGGPCRLDWLFRLQVEARDRCPKAFASVHLGWFPASNTHPYCLYGNVSAYSLLSQLPGSYTSSTLVHNYDCGPRDI